MDAFSLRDKDHWMTPVRGLITCRHDYSLLQHGVEIFLHLFLEDKGDGLGHEHDKWCGPGLQVRSYRWACHLEWRCLEVCLRDKKIIKYWRKNSFAAAGDVMADAGIWIAPINMCDGEDRLRKLRGHYS